MEFKEIFIELLDEKMGGNQTELARQTGIPIPTVNGWLTKDRTPRAEHLITLSKFFDVSVDYLLGIDRGYTKVPKKPFRLVPLHNKEDDKLLESIRDNIVLLDTNQLKYLAMAIELAGKKDDEG